MTTTRTDANTPAPSFKFFEGNASESRTKAQVTVRRGGLMVITQAAVDLLGENPTHVQLAYDAETRAIGIRSCAPEASGCYTLRTQAKSPSRLVGGGRFFKHHGLKTEQSHHLRRRRLRQRHHGLRAPRHGDCRDDHRDPGREAGPQVEGCLKPHLPHTPPSIIPEALHGGGSLRVSGTSSMASRKRTPAERQLDLHIVAAGMALGWSDTEIAGAVNADRGRRARELAEEKLRAKGLSKESIDRELATHPPEVVEISRQQVTYDKRHAESILVGMTQRHAREEIGRQLGAARRGVDRGNDGVAGVEGGCEGDHRPADRSDR